MSTHYAPPRGDRYSNNGFTVRFPGELPDDIEQDEEWCLVETAGRKKRIRFHDYHEVYRIPGLYEHLFYEHLKCNSPAVVCGLLAGQIHDHMSTLRVLDVGAGNGMVGEELSRRGVGHIVGVDIIPEAAAAAHRDRPEVYDGYHVADLTNLTTSSASRLAEALFNCLTVVAALGFGDIPPLAFANAFNLVSSPGWIAFNIRDSFIDEQRDDTSGFALLIRRMVDQGLMEIREERRYRHRFSTSGRPLHYHAIAALKIADVPPALIEEA